ncbi:TlpA family protein disulfide reductase [bacterium]|nr:MAG: TlpA family protein disulfide reductase [bacterium]
MSTMVQRSLNLVLALALGSLVVAGCTLASENPESGYGTDASGNETYKGHNVSKYHPRRASSEEPETPKSGGGEVCPLPPTAEKDVLQKYKVGDVFPDFVLKDVVSGKEVKRSEHGKGHYQMILMWASWCPYCRTAQEKSAKPIFEELNKDGKTRLDVIGVGVNFLDDTPAAQKTFIQSNRIPWTCVFDQDAQVKDGIGSDFIPAVILLDESGKIVTYGYYMDDYARKLNNYLRDACEFKDKNPGK